MRVRRASVVWLEDGAQTFSDGFVIHLGLPDADSPEETHRLIAASLIHETGHMEFTDGSGRPAFDAARRSLAGSKYFWNLSEQLFQWLEDARIQVREHIEHPEHDALVMESYGSAVRRLETQWPTSSRGELWTAEPTSAIGQLWFALAERILVGDQGHATAPIVSEILAKAEPIITAARNSEHTHGAREAALSLTELVMRRFGALQS